MRHLKTSLAVLGAAIILVLAANSVAFAATGGKFFLGKSNFANKQTTLTRTTPGTTLKINTKSSANAPLATNGRGKVTNLNADKVDGLDSSALRTRSYVVTKAVTVATGNVTVPVSVPVGTYLFDYSALLAGASSGAVNCQIVRTHNSVDSYVAVLQFTAGALSPGLAASGLVVKAPGDTIKLECGAENQFTTTPGIPIQVVMTPTTVIGTISARAAP